MKIVIAGLGAAGANAARAIAAGRPDAEVEIYGAEPHPYYARPKLPAFLAGELDQQALYFYPPSWYPEHHINIHTAAPVARINPAAHTVTLATGATVAYDRLLVATGARSLIPPLEGVDLPGVFTLWTIEDAARIRTHAQGCKRAAVIGGGLLGLEAARGLRAQGLEVTVLEVAPWLMPRQLDEQGAAVFRSLVEGAGIAVRVGVKCERIEGRGVVQAVSFAGGERIPADLVLIAAGGRADLSLAQASGLQVNKGIVVNSRLQTSAPDVYAAGDVAEFAGTVYGIVPAAIEQAQAAAHNMAEIGTREYAGTVPTHTLKVVGVDLTAVGRITGGEGYTELRRAGAGEYIKLVLKEGRLQGAILLGRRGLVSPVSQAVARQAYLGPQPELALQDGFDWKSAGLRQ